MRVPAEEARMTPQIPRDLAAACIVNDEDGRPALLNAEESRVLSAEPPQNRPSRKPMPEPEEPYYSSAGPLVPDTLEIDVVAKAAKGCQACHLWRHGTQTVFGEGSRKPDIVLIG